MPVNACGRSALETGRDGSLGFTLRDIPISLSHSTGTRRLRKSHILRLICNLQGKLPSPCRQVSQPNSIGRSRFSGEKLKLTVDRRRLFSSLTEVEGMSSRQLRRHKAISTPGYPISCLQTMRYPAIRSLAMVQFGYGCWKATTYWSVLPLSPAGK